MQRSHSVRITALTVGANAKWVDNVLSHYSVVGVEQGTRGVARQLSDDAILALAVCRLLASELGVPLANAVSIANKVVLDRSVGSGRFDPAPELSLQFSLDAIERRVRARLADAAESVAHVRRGRPPSRSRTEK